MSRCRSSEGSECSCRASTRQTHPPSPRSEKRSAPRRKLATIDQYLAGVSGPQRAALERLRRQIKAAAPRAEEGISYGLAAFRLDGRPLVAFGATASHCAFYPMSSTTVKAFQKELAGYDTSTGTIRFQADKPLPATLVRRLIKARIAESQSRAR